MLYALHDTRLYSLFTPPLARLRTTVSESLPPLITVITLAESLRPLSPSPHSRAPRAARVARALMALSKLSADDEHGIILALKT